jgi:hypothetical protein
MSTFTRVYFVNRAPSIAEHEAFDLPEEFGSPAMTPDDSGTVVEVPTRRDPRWQVGRDVTAAPSDDQADGDY